MKVFGLSLFVLNLALGVTLVIAFALVRSRGPASVVALFTFGISTLFVLCMLVVAGSLSFKVWNDVVITPMGMSTVSALPTLAASSPPAAPPSSNASPATDKGGNDPTANAIGAISAVVAVVTLVLSLGTSWFAAQMSRVAKAEDKLKRAIARADRESDLARASRDAQDALLDAKFALFTYLAKSKRIRNLGEEFPHWSIALERLLSDSLKARRNAFDVLKVLAPADLNEPISDELKPVEHYSRLCDGLARARLKARSPAENKAAPVDPESGLWCLVFDPLERLRYELLLNQP